MRMCTKIPPPQQQLQHKAIICHQTLTSTFWISGPHPRTENESGRREYRPGAGAGELGMTFVPFGSASLVRRGAPLEQTSLPPLNPPPPLDIERGGSDVRTTRKARYMGGAEHQTDPGLLQSGEAAAKLQRCRASKKCCRADKTFPPHPPGKCRKMSLGHLSHKSGKPGKINNLSRFFQAAFSAL